MRGPLDVQAWTLTDLEYGSLWGWVAGVVHCGLRSRWPAAVLALRARVSVGAASRTRNALPPNRSGAPPLRGAPLGLRLDCRDREQVRRHGAGLTSNKRMQLPDASGLRNVGL